ncbi:MAG: ABC transporter ATP-binding protein [Chloroflexi bacterium]|nr:ABC transporter ATP-binding protein [Chloroflexota bacterium]
MPALLSAHNLSKNYGEIAALRDVTLDIEEGTTGLLGANGAGKSTLMTVFLGITKPTSGSFTVLGGDGSDSINAHRLIGYSPEYECLPPNVSAAEFVTHMARVSGIPRTEARTRATDVLRHVGLDEERYRPMGTYSTGMKQRAKLAQAIVHDPVLVLLDEPTAGLDPTGRQEMLDLISRTSHEFGISMLISSHLMGDIERTCDRIVVLEAGEILEQGEVSRYTAETETLVAEFDEGLEEVAIVLERNGITAEVEGRTLVIYEAAADDLDVIRDAVVETGALLHRLAPRVHSLSDIFRGKAP